MELLYYLLILLLVIGVPILALCFIISAIKPEKFNQGRAEEWSRKKILGIGFGTLLVFVTVLGFGINGTMPQSVRADIEARNAATKQLKIDEQNKAQIQAAPKADVSEVKTETTKSTIDFATIEKTDAALPKGERKVTTAGVVGERTETFEVTYIGGKQSDRKLVKSEISKVPVDEIISVGTYVAPRASTAAPKTTSPTPAPSNNNSSAYYANCTAARNAGAAPIYRGQPGYRSALDRDNDGVACE